MATYTFNGSSQTTPTFNPAVDVVQLNVPLSSIRDFTQSGSNVTIVTASGTLTLTGVSLAALTQSNFQLQGGASAGIVQIGDNTTGTTADQFGNTLTGGAQGDLLLGLGGADTINAGNGDNLIFGGSGRNDPSDLGDSITGGTGNDTIYANGGNDSVVGTSGSDLIYGGLGQDTIGFTTAQSVNSGQSASVFGGGDFVDTVDGADTLNITSAGNLFASGNAGNDTLNVSVTGGTATVNGGLGNDTFAASVSGGTAQIFGGGTAADTDTINVTVSGGSTSIYGGSGINDGADGADTITVSGTVASSSTTVFGNAGADTVNINAVAASAGSNFVVYGGLGNDSINATVIGAAGNLSNLIVYGGASDSDVITMAGTSANYNAVIYGGDGTNSSNDLADTIIGGAGNEVIYGNGGNDVINTGAGSDQIYAGVGNDTVNVDGAGTKVIVAADGDDVINANGNIGSIVTLDGGIGNDVLNLGVGGAANGTQTLANVTNVETINLSGTATTINATDSLVASGQSLNVNGSALTGALVFNGAAETDGTFTISGSSVAGGDTLTGGALNDVINAGAGTDIITGGRGADVLSGGADADAFRFAFGDSGSTTATVDRITDLNLGSNVGGGVVDTIDVVPGTNIAFATGVAAAGGGASTTVGIDAASAVAVASLDAAIAAMTASTNATNGQAALFNIGGQLYLVGETGANHTTFNAATDIAINVTGVTGTLDASDIA